MGMNHETGYGRLLRDGGFEAFLWTQFLGAFNDNVYKMIVSIFAVSVAVDGNLSSRNLALAGAVFVVPFLLFAGYSGQLADRFSKTRVLRTTKAFEIVIMLLGTGALLAGRIEFLLIILFLLATQANFFSPAKYGILPEMLPESSLSRANGLLELTTFVAIVIGTSFGTFLYQHWKLEPLRMGLTLVAIAVAGSLCSIRIPRVPAAGSAEAFHWNPLHEITAGTRELWNRRPLAFAVAGLTWFWFMGALFQMALLLIGAESLHVSETLVGFLVASLAAGVGIGSVVAGALSGDYIELALVPAGAAVMGVSSMMAGTTLNYTAMLVSLALVGFGGGLFAVPLNAFLQERAAKQERGRILATNSFANMLGVILASATLWLLHDRLHWSAALIMLALGVTMLAGSGYIVSRMPETVVRFILWCLATALFRIRIEGKGNMPLSGSALVISNHISYADSVLVGYTSRRRTMHFLMWQPIFNLPVLNYFFRILRAIPIHSESPRSTIHALRAARAELNRGELVAIFPEGGISHDGGVRPFERGFAKILQGADAPLIPIHLEGLYGHPLSYAAGGPFRSWKKLWRPTVTIRIGAPVHGSVSAEELREVVVELSKAERTRSVHA